MANPQLKSTQLTVGSGNYTVPANISYIRIKMIGAGAGGSGWLNGAGAVRGGGGSGESILDVYLAVVASEVIPYVVGAAGLGGVFSAIATNGAATTFGPGTLFGQLSCAGGLAPTLGNTGGAGGGRTGGAGGPGTGNAGSPGNFAYPWVYGGSGGGANGGVSAANIGGPGGDSIGFPGGLGGQDVTVGFSDGGGGAASPWGSGGKGGDAILIGIGNPGVAPAAGCYGAGGGAGCSCGGTAAQQKSSGGNGMDGVIEIVYVG